MTPEEFERIRRIFHAVRGLSPEERIAHLEKVCGDDAELRGEVEALLARKDAPGAVLDLSSPVGAVRSDLERLIEAQQGEPTPKRVGPYTILEKLGEGGMGVVFLAEQEQPKRKVALKVLRSGIASQSMLRRFEYEASILGHLEHSGIAQIFEAGSGAMERVDGSTMPCHFFAMEYVRGEPLSDHVAQAEPTVRERLALVAHVCDAVHHAHQKGVIHRDLKPGNILVDEHGQPKVLDFGVARATDTDIQTVTMRTEPGQLVGTMPYMSPEQVSGVSENVDTRSDVYALGVIAYELLTGRVPHDVQNMTIPQAVRVIERDDVTPLSSINKTLRGDVDTIVSKALDKDKDRRYQSASDFAADIRRFLSDQPISARPATTFYQLRKFARRNRALVTATIVIIIVLSAALVRVTLERNRALTAERLAEERRQEAERQTMILQAVNDFLNNDLLAAVAPDRQGKDVLMRDVLDTAAENVEGKFVDAPLIEVAIRTTLGNTYKKLGEFDVAAVHLGRALELGRSELGAEHLRTLVAMSNLGNLFRRQGRFDEAEPLLVKTLEIRRRKLGEEHRDTLISMNNLASLRYRRGHVDEAESLYAQILDTRRVLLGEEHPETLLSMNNLAAMYEAQERFDEAEPLYIKTLEIRRRVLGEEHPHTVLSMSNLAVLYHNRGELDKTEPLYRKTLEIRRRVLGEEHPRTLVAKDNLAILFRQQGRLDEADSLIAEVLEARRRLLGEEHPDTLNTMNNLAVICEHRGRLDEAERLYKKTLQGRRRLLGDKHVRTMISMNNLGAFYWKQGRADEAGVLFEDAFKNRRLVLGEQHPSTQQSRSNLLDAYKATGQLDKARPIAADVLAGYKARATGPDPTVNAMNSYAWELLTCPVKDLRDPQTALELGRKIVAATDSKNPDKLDTLALAQHMTGDSRAAVATQKKAVALLPAGPSGTRRNFESSLVKYMLGAQQFSEAEPWLLAVYQLASADDAISPSQKRASVEPLITLYDSWHAAEAGKGYDTKAAEYRALLAKIPAE